MMLNQLLVGAVVVLFLTVVIALTNPTKDD
jgi:hypothetical protein